MAVATLQAIQKKVRNITRSLSDNQLPTTDLNNYINTFIYYDFPENLRLFNLRTTFSFYTQPNVDTYFSNSTDPNDPFYQFKDKYIAVHPPVFLAGIPGFYTQDRAVFYSYWPQTNTVTDTLLRGNGTPGPFTGTVTAFPVLQNNVMFNCPDATNTNMILIDYPVSRTTGALGLPNTPQTIPSPFGQIDYITGAYTLNFPANTLNGGIIYSNTIPYLAGRPLSMLYYADIFTIRPVPDKSYVIQIDVDMAPTQLINLTDTPQIEQWWQYIAWGTAIKVFEDRMDMDSINQIMPMFKEQEAMVQRRTLEQQCTQRTVTIYTQTKNYGFGWFGPGVGWP